MAYEPAADREDAEARRLRLLQEQLERRLREEAEQEERVALGDGDAPPHDDLLPVGPAAPGPDLAAASATAKPRRGLDYCTASLGLVAAMLYYALRTRRGQWYPALVYLASSKWALLVAGNAAVAAAVRAFDAAARRFLGGLRLAEAEGLQDFVRWNLTETCIALTIFRSELDAPTAAQFLCLVWAKCLHHVAALRETHTRLTLEIVVPNGPAEDSDGDTSEGPGPWWLPGPMRVPWVHVKLILLLVLLQWMDAHMVYATTVSILEHGPSVHILFAFEAAILLVLAWSHLMLWGLHALDGCLHVLAARPGLCRRLLLPRWKDYKATFMFAVQLQAQGVQFLFYVMFFGIVMMYYGMPLNLFREVYMSFVAFKERLVAFAKYRRLMAGMERFADATEEQLNAAGRICIICRDEMTVTDCKRLPVCGHTYHKSCLREWLVQQQSCPTCRSDISTMETLERARRAAERATGDRVQRLEQEETAEEEESKAEEEYEEEDGSQLSETEIIFREIEEGEESDSGLPHVLRRRRASIRSERLEFPALYRICIPTPGGATVWNDNMVAMRNIPYGTMVLCLGEDERLGRRFLQVPDGWIYQSSAQRLQAVADIQG